MLILIDCNDDIRSIWDIFIIVITLERQQADCHYILCSYRNIASSHPSTFPSDPFFIPLPSTTPKTVETANVTNPLAIKLLLNR